MRLPKCSVPVKSVIFCSFDWARPRPGAAKIRAPAPIPLRTLRRETSTLRAFVVIGCSFSSWHADRAAADQIVDLAPAEPQLPEHLDAIHPDKPPAGPAHPTRRSRQLWNHVDDLAGFAFQSHEVLARGNMRIAQDVVDVVNALRDRVCIA